MDVVFLHGWLMGPYVWDHQVAALDGIANTHVFAAPAHGTPAPPEGFTMADWADLVISELDRRSVGQAIFVGHSMGSFLTHRSGVTMLNACSGSVSLQRRSGRRRSTSSNSSLG